jgi:DNA replication protein DnaC
MNLDDAIKKQLECLGLSNLTENWDKFFSEATKQKPSYHRFLTEIIDKEYHFRKERQRVARIKRAHIPEIWVMETFPFGKQPNLKKKLIMELYDSMKFMTNPQEMIFIGPSGCGKTGLATSYLIHALNNEYRGCFVFFKDLIDMLFQSAAGHTEKKIIQRLKDYDILLIDEIGYDPIHPEQAGLFFELMKKRHKKKTTIITTQLGFDEWPSFLQNHHLTNALLDRFTVNCTVFNMKDCISIRPKNIVHAASNK